MSRGCKPDFSEAFARLSLLGGEDDISQTRAANARPAAGPVASIGTVNGPIYFLGHVAPADLASVLAATQKQGAKDEA